MAHTRCTGSALALEYNEKYLDNVKLACYCPSCSKTEVREPTPYKIIQTANEYVEIFDESFKHEKVLEDEQDPKDAYDYEEQRE